MYLLCVALWYCFFAPINIVVRAAYWALTRLFITLTVCVGGYILGCILYGAYLGLQ